MTRSTQGFHPRRAIVAILSLVLGGATPIPARTGVDAASPAPPVLAAAVAAWDAAWTPPPPADPRKLLPAECRFEIGEGAQRGTWFGRSCLVATFAHWPILPVHCERRLDLTRRRETVVVYDPLCLAAFGYRVEDAPTGTPP